MRNKPKTTTIRCTTCGKGTLRPKVINYDVGPLIDMKRVFVENLPALVCSNCATVSLHGGVLETISLHLAAEILQRPELAPLEVRYLRKLIGDTQDEFAHRLGITRATANRWENSDEHVKGPDAYAIRSHAFFRLRERGQVIDSIAPAFTSEHPPQRPKKKGYSIKAADLVAA